VVMGIATFLDCQIRFFDFSITEDFIEDYTKESTKDYMK